MFTIPVPEFVTGLAGIVALIVVFVALRATGRARTAERALATRTEENAELQQKLEQSRQECLVLRTRLEADANSHAQRLADLRAVHTDIERKFSAAASDTLAKTSESFLRLAGEQHARHQATADHDLQRRQEAIGNLVGPIGVALEKFQQRIGEIEKSREGAYERVSEMVRALHQGQAELHHETTRLVQALRQPKTRGLWGEYQLRNVLEMAGMTEHVDFVTEKTVAGDDGRLRPDVIVRLPGDRRIVVDAKTPLDAYLKAVETDDETQRGNLLQEHARQVRRHADQLGSKKYHDALPGSPDFVVMFVPGEVFFSAALDCDATLLDHAIRKRVLLTTPTTLLALLKSISYGWQQENLARNIAEINRLASELFNRMSTFGGHLAAVGKGLRQATENYNRSIFTLEHRVLSSARKLQSLGAAPSQAGIDAIAPLEAQPIEPAHLPATTTGPEQAQEDLMTGMSDEYRPGSGRKVPA